MLKIISSTLYHPRPDNRGVWCEPYRKDVNAPISFFEHDGQNLHVIEGFSGDCHNHLVFPNSDIRAAGRVARDRSKGSANLDPDGMTVELFNRIVADVYGEYAADMMWEWTGEWYNTQELFSEIEEFEHLTSKH